MLETRISYYQLFRKLFSYLGCSPSCARRQIVNSRPLKIQPIVFPAGVQKTAVRLLFKQLSWGSTSWQGRTSIIKEQASVEIIESNKLGKDFPINHALGTYKRNKTPHSLRRQKSLRSCGWLFFFFFLLSIHILHVVKLVKISQLHKTLVVVHIFTQKEFLKKNFTANMLFLPKNHSNPGRSKNFSTKTYFCQIFPYDLKWSIFEKMMKLVKGWRRHLDVRGVCLYAHLPQIETEKSLNISFKTSLQSKPRTHTHIFCILRSHFLWINPIAAVWSLFYGDTSFSYTFYGAILLITCRRRIANVILSRCKCR